MPTHEATEATLEENAGLRRRIAELEQELGAARATLEARQRLLNAVPAYLYVFDLTKGAPTYHNREIAEFLGIETAETQESGAAIVARLMHPDDLARLGQIYGRLSALKDGAIDESEYRIRRPTGEWIWVHDRKTAFTRAPDGSLREYVGVVQDITARKLAEESLREREAALHRVDAELEQRIEDRMADLHRTDSLLQNIIDNLPTSVLVKNADGRFMMVNRRAAAAMGLAREQIVGKVDVELFSPDVVAKWRDYDQKALAGQLLQTEDTHRREDGMHTYLTTNFPIRDGQGTIYAVGTIATDITERRRAEEERSALQAQVINAQRAAIQRLGTPLIPLADGVLVMPLIGTVDRLRAQQILAALLEGVAAQRARVAIVDITGVEIVDGEVADALIRAAKAVKLLGAEVVITGVQPDIARTLVALGADLRGITTRGTLQDGVAAALRRAPEARARGPG